MTDSTLRRFLNDAVTRIEPVSRRVNLAYWNATISGRTSDFDRLAELHVELQTIYSNADDFEKIRRWKESPDSGNEIDRRQIDLLYATYLRNQIEPALNQRITKLATAIENQFNVYRATFDGRVVTSNDILTILKESTDSVERRQAWEAGKSVAGVVRDDLIALVHLRNEAAVSLGYDNYYAMSLHLSEQSEDELVVLFDNLDRLTRASYEEMKELMDERLATRYGIDRSDIRPWHYEDPFAQEAPRIYDVQLDSYYEKHDILDVVSTFFEGIGLPVTDIIGRSDLYEKPGKDQHAYCTDIDRRGDIRILANIKNDETWAGTMLHELGHAVHDKYVDPQLPFLLRQEAHILTTEAIAMLFGRLSKEPQWMEDALGISRDERDRIADEVNESQRASQLMFARWSQVMMRFERELYTDPSQDLDDLWWQLVERYQLITPPDDRDYPHWAAKSHIVSVPVYYHNYLLGELLASQLAHHISSNVLGSDVSSSFAGCPAVGDYLKTHIFGPGARYRWDRLIEQATGEPLTPRYFADQFVHR